MSRPAEQPLSDDQRTAVRDDRRLRSTWSRLVARHRRCLLVLLAICWLALAAGIVETIVESPRTVVAVVGAITGVALGVYGRREFPAIDDAADWFAFTTLPTVPRAERQSRGIGSLVLSVLVAGIGVFVLIRFVIPLIDPFPTSFMLGLGLVFAGVMLFRSWRPPSDALSS